MKEVLSVVAGLSEGEGPGGKVQLGHLEQGLFSLIAVNTALTTGKDGTRYS